jgi:indole-3-acetate monooxygenase
MALWQRGFMSIAGFAQAPPVVLGLARRAIEEFRQLAQTKQSAFGGPRLVEQVQAQSGLARAEALVRAARTYWYNEIETLWGAAVQDHPNSVEQRVSQRLANLLATEHCVAAVDLLYRLAGSSSIFQSSALERCFRDDSLIHDPLAGGRPRVPRQGVQYVAAHGPREIQ